MANSNQSALLPVGLEDLLPPEARKEALAISRLIECFSVHGYEQVKPPLLEFEESLLTGTSTDFVRQTFRLMDPISQEMMGLRSDITMQVVRLAASRLKDTPRPLRLSYHGQVVKVRGSQLRPMRQFTQAGVELIGLLPECQIAGNAEVMVLATKALADLGLSDLSIDIVVPSLAASLAQEYNISNPAQLLEALDRKDAAAVANLARDQSDLFLALLRACGPIDQALALLSDLNAGPALGAMLSQVRSLVDHLSIQLPASIRLTFDPTEQRGFEYHHQDIGFSIYTPQVKAVLGKGGQYKTQTPERHEIACGFTLFVDSLLRVLHRFEEKVSQGQRQRILLPFDCPVDQANELRKELRKKRQARSQEKGVQDLEFSAITCLEEVDDLVGEAKRQNCTHFWSKGQIHPL